MLWYASVCFRLVQCAMKNMVWQFVSWLLYWDCGPVYVYVVNNILSLYVRLCLFREYYIVVWFTRLWLFREYYIVVVYARLCLFREYYIVVVRPFMFISWTVYCRGTPVYGYFVNTILSWNARLCLFREYYAGIICQYMYIIPYANLCLR